MNLRASVPVASVLVACAFVGCGTQAEAPEPAAAATTPNPELVRVKRFWRVFREATDARIAGRIDEAVTRYVEALSLDPEHEDSLFYLGQCHKLRGEHQAALERWQQLVAIQPNAKRGFTEIGLLLSSAGDGAPFDLERAGEAFQAAFDMNPEESGSMLHLGELAVATGDTDAAVRWLEGVQRSNPRAVAAPFLLGYLAWSQGDGARARKSLEAAAARLVVEQGHSPSFEGQTKKGAGAMVDAGVAARSLLEPFWKTWARDRAAGSGVTDAEAVYRGVDRFLAELRAAGPVAARPLRPL